MKKDVQHIIDISFQVFDRKFLLETIKIDFYTFSLIYTVF